MSSGNRPAVLFSVTGRGFNAIINHAGNHPRGAGFGARINRKDDQTLKIRLPATVKAIIDTLQAKGFEAYAVGGCVRDSILGRKPDDWDITTSARPEQVKKIFQRTVDTGLAHGTVTVLLGSGVHEVTTYRIDGEYEDSRHPRDVTFTASLEEDLKRRDFTINAMAYNETAGLVDLYGGMEDLQKRRIRCVGNPLDRFGEDALRIMRSVRFSAQLHFTIEEKTWEAAKVLAPTLSRISAERICAELLKLLLSDHPEELKTAWEAGITRVVLPEFDELMKTPQNNPHHCWNVGEHTLNSLCRVEADKVLRLTMLLHDMGKPACRTIDPEGIDHFKGHGEVSARMAEEILRRLRMDHDTIQKVSKLTRYHDWRVEPAERNVRRAVNRMGRELFPLLLKVQTADTLAQSRWYREEKLDRIRKVQQVYRKILEENQCVSLKELAITGKDLIGLGMKPGPAIGEVLSGALEQVLEEPEKNTKEYLLDFCRKYRRK